MNLQINHKYVILTEERHGVGYVSVLLQLFMREGDLFECYFSGKS